MAANCIKKHPGLREDSLLDPRRDLETHGVDFYRVNVDELDEVVMEIDIRVVPTCIVFKDGKKVGYAVGVDAGNIHVGETYGPARWRLEQLEPEFYWYQKRLDYRIYVDQT
ncbi:hypothetical protein EDC04DRAFT_2608766 [Pisolithus marmoratus]|nr:hypothetical protein EDC04DRAFT_2608766 [Pisolithus marmoratus]